MPINRSPLAVLSIPALILAVVLAGCGSSTASIKSSSSHKSANASKNLGLINSNVLTVGSDTSYPPMESADPNHPGTFVGADVDIAKALAKAMGLQGAKIVNGNFDSLITSLQAKRYDIVMSSMNDTPERAKVVSFVDYMTAREGILVDKGSSTHANSYSALCGQTVTVERGTTELAGLGAANNSCSKKMTILTYTTDTDAYQSFASGHASAYTSDLPVIVDYVHSNPSRYRIAGHSFSASADYGIALRKGDTALKNAIAKALHKIMADGTYMKILRKWGVQEMALHKK